MRHSEPIPAEADDAPERDGIYQRRHHETYFPAIQAPPRADARISRSHEKRRRPQGSFGPARQGPRASVGLTGTTGRRVPPGLSSKPAQEASRYRLRGTGAFEAVFRAGARHDAHFVQLIVAPAAQSPGRVGYVIGRKMMRRAVDRNRLRRCLRETVHAGRPGIEAFDIVLRVRRTLRRDDIPLATAESRRLLAAVAGSR